MKNNFTQALRELTGFDGQPDPQESAGKNPDAYSFSEEIIEKKTVHSSVTTVKDFSETASDNCTRITGTMTVTGDIKSDDDIYVHGQLYGNINTTASVHSTDLIIGDISARNAFFKGARIKGSLSLSEDLILGENTLLIGDLKCKNADVAGKIKGNCSIDGSAGFASSALIVGDICACDISADQGAKIIGSVSTGARGIDVDAEFDFGGDL